MQPPTRETKVSDLSMKVPVIRISSRDTQLLHVKVISYEVESDIMVLEIISGEAHF